MPEQDTFLALLHEEREKTVSRYDKAQAAADTLKREVEAYDLLIARHTPRKPRKRKPVDLHVTAAEIEGMKLEPALLYIADRNDGLIQSTPVRQLLAAASVLNGRGEQQLYHFLSNSPRFESVHRGLYRVNVAWQPEDEMHPEERDLLRQYRGEN